MEDICDLNAESHFWILMHEVWIALSNPEFSISHETKRQVVFCDDTHYLSFQTVWLCYPQIEHF